MDLHSIESIDKCIYFYLPIVGDFYYYSSVLLFDVGEGDISSNFFFIIQQLKIILSYFFLHFFYEAENCGLSLMLEWTWWCSYLWVISAPVINPLHILL